MLSFFFFRLCRLDSAARSLPGCFVPEVKERSGRAFRELFLRDLPCLSEVPRESAFFSAPHFAKHLQAPLFYTYILRGWQSSGIFFFFFFFLEKKPERTGFSDALRRSVDYFLICREDATKE